MKEAGYSEKWVVYSTDKYSAKELTVYPGRSVTIKDAAAHGVIVIQGWGSIGAMGVETPAMIRFGEMTQRRGLYHGGRSQGRRPHHEPQRNGKSGDAEALRAWQSGCGLPASSVSPRGSGNENRRQYAFVDGGF